MAPLHRSLLAATSLLLAGLLLVTSAQGAKKLDTPKTPIVERGVLIRVLRDSSFLFYGKPHHPAKQGEMFEVLDVRPAANQVFIGFKDKDRLIALSLPLDAVEPLAKASKLERIDKAEALFAGLIPTLKIRIAPAEMDKLRKDPRAYVNVTMEELDGKTYQHLALKLKGSVGSFQPIDARPGFSLNFGKFGGDERFHGLKRFQLNNCNQDGTALNELIAGEIARKAGVPASRCTHALVTLNERDLGIYVLKEGFTEDFLAAFFPNTDGHLYDGGFCAEIRKDMELDRGDPTHQERLAELLATLAEPDQAKQNQQLPKIVDAEAYLRHLALENILTHWDGYSFNRNNYRLYENPETGRFHFILHGMDQTFNDAGQSLYRDPGGAVGAIFWRQPQFRERYTEILSDLYAKVIQTGDWPQRTEEVGRRLQAALAPEQAKGYESNINSARDRILNRINNIRRQMEAPNLLSTLKTKGEADLATAGWTPQLQNTKGEEVNFENRACLHLRAEGEGNGSWRLSVNLPQGKYRFEADLKTQGIDPLSPDSGAGAGLRISGGSRRGLNELSGNQDWKKAQFNFDSPGGDHILVLELRAKSGELWADRKTLRLVRLP